MFFLYNGICKWVQISWKLLFVLDNCINLIPCLFYDVELILDFLLQHALLEVTPSSPVLVLDFWLSRWKNFSCLYSSGLRSWNRCYWPCFYRPSSAVSASSWARAAPASSAPPQDPAMTSTLRTTTTLPRTILQRAPTPPPLHTLRVLRIDSRLPLTLHTLTMSPSRLPASTRYIASIKTPLTEDLVFKVP